MKSHSQSSARQHGTDTMVELIESEYDYSTWTGDRDSTNQVERHTFSFFPITDFSFQAFKRGIWGKNPKSHYFNFWRSFLQIFSIFLFVGMAVFALAATGPEKPQSDLQTISLLIMRILFAFGMTFGAALHLDMVFFPRRALHKKIHENSTVRSINGGFHFEFEKSELPKSKEKRPAHQFHFCLRRKDVKEFDWAVDGDPSRDPPFVRVWLFLVTAPFKLTLIIMALYAVYLIFGWAASLSINTFLLIMIFALLASRKGKNSE